MSRNPYGELYVVLVYLFRLSFATRKIRQTLGFLPDKSNVHDHFFFTSPLSYEGSDSSHYEEEKVEDRTVEDGEGHPVVRSSSSPDLLSDLFKLERLR